MPLACQLPLQGSLPPPHPLLPPHQCLPSEGRWAGASLLGGVKTIILPNTIFTYTDQSTFTPQSKINRIFDSSPQRGAFRRQQAAALRYPPHCFPCRRAGACSRPTVSPTPKSSLKGRLSAAAGLGIAKAFWNSQLRCGFSYTKSSRACCGGSTPLENSVTD